MTAATVNTADAEKSRFIARMADLRGYELGQTDAGWFLTSRATGQSSILGTGRSLEQIRQFLLADTFP